MPIILFGSPYWTGLLDWLDATMLAEAKVSPKDLDLVTVVDDPGQAATLLIDAIRHAGEPPIEP